MANRFWVAILIAGLISAGIGCGATDDEDVFVPTPTQGPPTPTPLPICEGIEVPSGLGCRAFTWQQPVSSISSGTQLFVTLPPAPGGTMFNFLPALVDNGVDPGIIFSDLPPGIALVADGFPDPLTGTVGVTIGVKPEDQLEPGFVIIGIKPLLDYICLKIDLESIQGTLYCNGSDSEGVDTRVTAAGGITSAADDVFEIPLGDSAPPGSLLLRFSQQQGRIIQGEAARYESCFELPECGPGERFACYRPQQQVAFTTGTAFGLKGATPLLNAELTEGITGEPFDCNAWTQSDGPGQLVQGLVDNDMSAPPPNDVATALRLGD